jgi:hypothetical protein
MSALPPKADIEMGAALRLLLTQSGHYPMAENNHDVFLFSVLVFS